MLTFAKIKLMWMQCCGRSHRAAADTDEYFLEMLSTNGFSIICLSKSRFSYKTIGTSLIVLACLKSRAGVVSVYTYMWHMSACKCGYKYASVFVSLFVSAVSYIFCGSCSSVFFNYPPAVVIRRRKGSYDIAARACEYKPRVPTQPH